MSIIQEIFFSYQGKKFFIRRNFEKYFFEKGFNFHLFYKENQPLFEKNTLYDLSCTFSFSNATDIGVTCIENIRFFPHYFFSKKTKNIQEIFFIEWGLYEIFDAQDKKIDTLYLDRRIGKYGKKEIPFLDTCFFITIFPSKNIHGDMISHIANYVEKIFPGSIHDPDGNFLSVGKMSKNTALLKKIQEQLSVVSLQYKIQYRIVKKPISEIDMRTDSILSDVEDEILMAGNDDKKNISVKQKYKTFDIPENRYLFQILKKIDLEKKYFFEFFSLCREKKISSKKSQKIPQKFLQHPVYREIYNQVQIFSSSQEKKYSNTGIRIDEDPITSFHILYEIYAFLEILNILEEMGMVYFDNKKMKLFDLKKQTFLRYEKNNKNGRIEARIGKKDIFCTFGEKILSKDPRGFWLLNEDLSCILHQWKKGGKDGVTPDFSIQVNDKLYIGDMKFSVFHDPSDDFQFPNPQYFTQELMKYRKITVQGKINTAPIFLAYPGNIEERHVKKFLTFQELTYKSYNIFLLPIFPSEKNMSHRHPEIRKKILDFFWKEFVPIKV